MIQLSPWTSGHFHGPVGRLAQTWLAPTGILGCSFGLAVLSRNEIFLLHFGARERLWGLVAGLAAPMLSLQALLLLGSAWQGDVRSGETFVQLLVLDLHLILLALLLWSLGLPSLGRLALFLGIAWLLPGLLADVGLLGHWTHPLTAPIRAGGAMGPFAPRAESALLWLLGQALLFAATWFLLVPRKTPRA